MAASSSVENTNKEEHLPNIIKTLPKTEAWIEGSLRQYQGHWIPEQMLEGILVLQKEFKSQPSTIILVSFPKSGTTWLKALLFTVMNRNRYDYAAHPLLSMNPHECVPWMEACTRESHLRHLLYNGSLLSSHLPCHSLPEQIKSSECPVVYICRNPKDVFVSLWSFINKSRVNQGRSFLALEEAFDMFCNGVLPFGPYWDHLLGYWRMGLEFPNKVLFLMYEDLKREPFVHVKRLAEFIGHPFSLEEENEGIIQRVIEFCSFQKLSSLTVNKDESHGPEDAQLFKFTNKMFFRKGEVGDYKNYLTEAMVKRLNKITVHKLHGSGLTMPL